MQGSCEVPQSGQASGLCDDKTVGHHIEASEWTREPFIIERGAVERLLIALDQQTPEPSTHSLLHFYAIIMFDKSFGPRSLHCSCCALSDLIEVCSFCADVHNQELLLSSLFIICGGMII